MAIKKSEGSSYIWLRPGANVFKQAIDSLQIAFPNYTVTFQTPAIVRVVEEIVNLLASTNKVDTIIKKAVRSLGVEENIVDYVLFQLISNNCAYYGSKKSDAPDENQLANFFKYVYEKPDASVKLNAGAFLLLTSGDKVEICNSVFGGNGMNVKIIPAIKGATNKSYHEQLSALAGSDSKFIACWGFPYRLPTANMINGFAVKQKVPVIFGGCEGIIGRIGPLIIPFSSACLECLHLRLLSNFEDNESRSYTTFRTLEENTIASSWITHPGFEMAMLQLFSIEVMRIVLGLTANCLGSFTEYTFGQSNSGRHNIIKVPNCPVCGNVKPARFSWDYQISAPIVKNNS